jgi:hypothetical protein
MSLSQSSQDNLVASVQRMIELGELQPELANVYVVRIHASQTSNLPN